MPIRKSSTLSIDDQPEKSSYVKKADRGFAPDDLPLYPSTIDLSTRIYKALREDKNSYPQSRVYASGIKDCARRIGFSLMGFDAAEIGLDSPHWMMTTAIGTLIHQLFERLLPATGILKASEFRVESEDGSLSGRVDAILEVPDTLYRDELEEYILDVKSVGKKDFEDGCWGRKVPGYFQQIQVYGHLLGVKKGIVLMVCRDDGRLFEFEFEIDSRLGTELLARAAVIHNKAKNRVVDVPEKLGTFECTFCPFRRQCAAEEETGIVQWELDQGTEPRSI